MAKIVELQKLLKEAVDLETRVTGRVREDTTDVPEYPEIRVRIGANIRPRKELIVRPEVVEKEAAKKTTELVETAIEINKKIETVQEQIEALKKTVAEYETELGDVAKQIININDHNLEKLQTIMGWARKIDDIVVWIEKEVKLGAMPTKVQRLDMIIQILEQQFPDVKRKIDDALNAWVEEVKKLNQAVHTTLGIRTGESLEYRGRLLEVNISGAISKLWGFLKSFWHKVTEAINKIVRADQAMHNLHDSIAEVFIAVR